MKFKCGFTPEEKKQKQLLHELAITAEADRLINWHRRFAWWPKHFPSGYCVWFGWYNARFNPHMPRISYTWQTYQANRENSEQYQQLRDYVANLIRGSWSGFVGQIRQCEKELDKKINWEYAE